jgi:hypothetical protein
MARLPLEPLLVALWRLICKGLRRASSDPLDRWNGEVLAYIGRTRADKTGKGRLGQARGAQHMDRIMRICNPLMPAMRVGVEQ